MPTMCARSLSLASSLVAMACVASTTLVAQDTSGEVRGKIVPTASRYLWSATERANLEQLFTDRATVKAFLNELASRGIENLPAAVAEVKDYRLVDLFGNGSVELVALIDETGRALFNTIEIVSRESADHVPPKAIVGKFEGFVVRQIYGFEIPDLKSVLSDIDGDGVSEVIVPTLLERYHGAAEPHAMIDEIYRWDRDGYMKASSQYAWYYQQVVLPKLIDELNRLDTTSDVGLPSSERTRRQLLKAALKTEIAEAKRRSSL